MIPYVGGNRIYQELKDQIDQAYDHIHRSGKWVDDYYTHSVENKLKKLTGRRHAKLVVSGTTAIQTALLSWEIIKKRVACVNYSYVASVNQAAMLNQVELYDVDKNALLNIENVFEQDAVIPVSLYGNTIDYDKLRISKNTKVIIDGAQSIGAKYKGRPEGSFGDVTIFSFARNKPVPTVGTQGALVWDDDNITDKIKTVSCNGQLERNAPITSLGVNGVPFELQAAWIDVGLDFLAKWQARRQHIHEYYKMKFKNLPVCIIEAGEHCESNFSKFVLTTNARDDLHAFMNSNKTQTLKHYTDNFSEFFGSNKSFPQTEKFCDTVLSLPNHAWLTDAEIETVADLVNNFFDLK